MSAIVTRYAGLTRLKAAAAIGFILVAEGWFVAGAVSGSGAATGVASAPHRDGDVAFYKSVVAGVRAGQDYYDVVDIELRRQGYPVRPAFAWRQPTYAWLLSRLPSPLLGHALLALVGIAVAWSAPRWVASTGPVA